MFILFVTLHVSVCEEARVRHIPKHKCEMHLTDRTGTGIYHKKDFDTFCCRLRAKITLSRLLPLCTTITTAIVSNMKLYSGIVTLMLSIITVQAANIDIQWSIQAYDDVTAQVGDTITFTWSSGHNVYIQPSGTCQADGAILVGETPPAIYTFSAEDLGQDLFFVCGVAGHCDAGQTITVSVTDATGTEDIPTPAPMEAEGGSSIIPSLGPSTVGGGGTTQAPTSSSAGTKSTITTGTIVFCTVALLANAAALLW